MEFKYEVICSKCGRVAIFEYKNRELAFRFSETFSSSEHLLYVKVMKTNG